MGVATGAVMTIGAGVGSATGTGVACVIAIEVATGAGIGVAEAAVAECWAGTVLQAPSIASVPIRHMR